MRVWSGMSYREEKREKERGRERKIRELGKEREIDGETGLH